MSEETKPCPHLVADGDGRAHCELAETGIRVFERQAKDNEQLARDWKHEFTMYRDAWVRELGGKFVNKTHEIDSLVLTTRRLRERADAARTLKERVAAQGFHAVLEELKGLSEGKGDGLLRFYIKSASDVAKNMEHAAAEARVL